MYVCMGFFLLRMSMVEEGLFRVSGWVFLLLLRVRWGLCMDRVLRQDMWGMGLRVFEEWVY